MSELDAVELEALARLYAAEVRDSRLTDAEADARFVAMLDVRVAAGEFTREAADLALATYRWGSS